LVQIGADRAHRQTRSFDEDGFPGPPAERLNPHLPGSGEEVEESAARDIVTQDAEQRRLGAIRNRSSSSSRHGFEPSALRLSCDDTHMRSACGLLAQ
jgi:hypothetical protein